MKIVDSAKSVTLLEYFDDYHYSEKKTAYRFQLIR